MSLLIYRRLRASFRGERMDWEKRDGQGYHGESVVGRLLGATAHVLVEFFPGLADVDDPTFSSFWEALERRFRRIEEESSVNKMC